MKICKRVAVIGLVLLLIVLAIVPLFYVLTLKVDAAQDRPLKIWFENENGQMQTFCLVDENTGVNYIVVTGELYSDPVGVAITPRLNADGSLYITP